MYRLVVSYHQPEDAAAFDDYYTSTHAPLANKIEGLRKFTTGHCESMDASPPPYYMIAELTFDSKEAMGAAFASPEGAAATGDLPSFAGAGVTMLSYDERDRS